MKRHSSRGQIRSINLNLVENMGMIDRPENFGARPIRIASPRMEKPVRPTPDRDACKKKVSYNARRSRLRLNPGKSRCDKEVWRPTLIDRRGRTGGWNGSFWLQSCKRGGCGCSGSSWRLHMRLRWSYTCGQQHDNTP